MHHADFNAHIYLAHAHTSRAIAPAPTRAPRGVRWARLALVLAAATLLAACGGGGGGAGDEPRADIPCNPDTLDCASMYAEYPFRAVPDTAAGADIYTFSDAPRAGFTIVRN